MIPAKIKVMALAVIMALSEIYKPYINQQKTPKVKILYILNDRLDVSLVLIVKMAWGKKEAVVKEAAM